MLEPEARALCLGHEAGEAAFTRAMQSGRLPHAWLLRGPAGIGKATLAFRLARMLLGGGDPGAQDPGSAVFRSVAHGSHPDLRVMRRELNPKSGKMRTEITIDQVRAVTDKLHATSARGGARVLIVDQIDELNRNAANAMLKLLEEPPAGVVLLLVCNRPGLVLATIRSRCSQMALRPLDAAQCATLVEELLPDLDARARAALVAIAEGSPGRALRLHEAGFLERYAQLLEHIGAGGPPMALAWDISETAAGMVGEGGIDLAVELLAALVRRTALTAAGRRPEALLAPGEVAVLEDLAARHALDRWAGLWDKLSQLPGRVEGLNMDARQELLLAAQALVGGAPALLDP